MWHLFIKIRKYFGFIGCLLPLFHLKDIPWTTVAQNVEVGIHVKRWSEFCGQLVWSIYETIEIM